MTFLGEFDRIADQIDDALPESSKISMNHIDIGTLVSECQFQVLCGSRLGNKLQSAFDTVSEREWRHLQIDSPVLDLGEIQYPVDYLKCENGRIPNSLNILPLLFR